MKKKAIKTVTIPRKDLEDTSWLKKPMDLQQNIPGADQEHFNHTKSTFMQASKVTDPEQILIEGAKEFIEIFKKPELALNEAANALWAINYHKKQTDDLSSAHYLFIEILTNIISPWVRKDSTMISDMAGGIKEIYEYGGADYFNEAFIDLLTCHIYVEHESGGHIDEKLLESLRAFRVIGNTITEYSDALEEIKRKAA